MVAAPELFLERRVVLADFYFLLWSGLIYELHEFVQRQVIANFFRRSAGCGAQEMEQAAATDSKGITVIAISGVKPRDCGAGFG